MDTVEVVRKLTGGTMTAASIAVASANDWFSGITVSGFTAASVALAGGGLLIYDNIRAKLRENRKKDLELEIELEARRKEMLSAQIESLRQASDENQARMRQTLHDVNNKLAAIVMERDVLREDLHATQTALLETQADLRETLDRWQGAAEELQRANGQIAESERRITELTRQVEALRSQAARIEGNTRRAADDVRKLSDASSNSHSRSDSNPPPDATRES
jgi:chromosome segregation ATPase